MTTHRPRVRSTLIRALIITVVAAALVVAYRTWDYVEARRLERQLAAIEGGGESLTRHNLSRPLRLPESADNAERYYVAAAELLESSQFGPASKAMAALRRSEPAPAPDAAQWAVVREWINSNTLALDLLATAARHEWGPGSPHRVGESGYAPVFGFVRLAELVAARGFDLARSGSAEPAAAVLVNGWRMMRRGQDPFFSTWSAVLSRSLVLGVQSVLGSGAQTDETLRRLQTEIVGLDRADALERALIAERTRGWELMWQPLLPSRWGWNRWFRPGRLTPPIVEFIVRPAYAVAPPNTCS